MISRLKKLRVILAIIFFIPVLFIFLDFRKAIPDNIFSIVTFLQFLPSFLKFISVLSISAIGFVIVIVLTVLFGRVYCSTICPLGVFQDIITRIANRFKKKKQRYFKYGKPLNIFRYSFLCISILFFVFGSVLLFNWLDPYSIFGRFSTYFFKPVVVWANNLLAHIFESINIYFFYNISQKPIQTGVYIVPVILFITVIRLSAKNGRIFCNSICPVGSVLGLVSKISLFKISIDNKTCTSCGLCERVCKAQCMNFKDFYVDETRCVGCYNCLTVCKSNSVKYNFFFPDFWNRQVKSKIENNEHDDKRRKIITGTFAYILALAGISLRKASAARQEYLMEQTQNDTADTIVTRHLGIVPVDDRGTITPPGSFNINQFTSKCTACSLCVSACPTGVLQPSFLEYGFLGIMQPHMDFKSGFCNYDCIKCTEVCPTGAILPQELEPKKLIQMGIAKFVKKNCIVETKGKDCGACSEHCPTKACHMIPYKGKVVIPEVNEDLCIGCGACEHVCPAEPYLAIYIEANKEHKEAQKPKIEKLEENLFEDEFPF